jgi:ATP-dependent DNA helicase RecG
MAALSESTIRRLIVGGETATVELKVASPRPVEMAERLCGMANARGGVVIVGVEDAERKIVGVPDERLALTKDVILRATRQIIKPILVLDPPEPEVYLVDGKQLVIATVPPNSGPVYQAGGVCWVRRGTYTVPLTVPEMLELANDRGLQDWEALPARRATMRDIDLERVEAYLSQRSTRGRHASRFEDIEQVLIGMECAIPTPGGEVIPTNAGILFFGRDPQQLIIQAEVVCVLYRDELGVGSYIDRKIITGTIQELIDEAEIFLNKHMTVGAKIEGWKRIDLPDYPIEALREAVVNAVVHRDYSRRGESIRVFYYADRIEIHSPGLLLPGITVEQMQRGEVSSKLRNPILAGLLRDIPGYMERIGSGIRLMLNETKEMGLPPPEFKEQSEFVVTFRKAPAPKKVIHAGATLWSEEEPGSTTGIRAAQEQLEQRFTLIMQYVREHEQITNREYRELASVSESTALRDLEALVERGSLQRVGKRRGRHYRLP